MKKLLLILLTLVATAVQAQEVPVKNPQPHITKLTRQEVVWIYTMKTRFWPDGTRITVFYLDKNSRAHRNFCQYVLGITPEHFNTLVHSYINLGNASYYRQARSSDDVYFRVSLIRGAVGYLDSNTLLVNGNGYVNEIKIQ